MSRRPAFATIAVALSIVITLAGLEGAFRVYWLLRHRRALASLPPLRERVVIPSADAELIYELNPGTHHGDVSINSWGMRDDETTLAKPPGCFRIAFVGDSISCGMGICEKQTLYHDVLERDLNAKAPPGRRIECLNFSANGYSIGQELRLFRLRVRAFDPDVVVLQSCLNDPYASSGPYAQEHSRWRSRLVSFLRERLSPARFWAESAVEVNYDDRGRAALLRGLREFSQEAKRGPPVLVVLFPYFYKPAYEEWGFERFHRIWSDDAAEVEIPLLDLKDELDRAGEIDRRWPKDPLHPTANGHRLAARAIRAELDRRGLLPAW